MSELVVDTLSERIKSDVEKTAANRQVVASGAFQQEQERWETIIDHLLINWGRNPRLLEDEDSEPPSLDIILLARRFAQWMRSAGMPAPRRVVPDPNGGITFEHWNGPTFETYEIGADGSIEYLAFVSSRLTSRARLPTDFTSRLW